MDNYLNAIDLNKTEVSFLSFSFLDSINFLFLFLFFSINFYFLKKIAFLLTILRMLNKKLKPKLRFYNT